MRPRVRARVNRTNCVRSCLCLGMVDRNRLLNQDYFEANGQIECIPRVCAIELQILAYHENEFNPTSIASKRSIGLGFPDNLESLNEAQD